MKKLILIALPFLIFTACSQEVSEVIGEEFKSGKAITMDELTTAMEGKDGMEDILVKGSVESVCQVKGCWMTVERENTESVHVTFKDYGFFMPMDLTGEVLMKGKAWYQETPVEELRHYAEDAGKSPEEIAAITEPKRELRFEASGVKILN